MKSRWKGKKRIEITLTLTEHHYNLLHQLVTREAINPFNQSERDKSKLLDSIWFQLEEGEYEAIEGKK